MSHAANDCARIEAERHQLRERVRELERIEAGLQITGKAYKAERDQLRDERHELQRRIGDLLDVMGECAMARDRYRAALEGLVRHVGVCDRRHYSGDVWECSYVIEARRTLADPTEAPHG